MSVCRVEDCERPFYGRGFCKMHWKRWHKHGDPHYVGQTPSERFWSKVEAVESGCWEWMASCRGNYGRFTPGSDGKSFFAHRYAYELTVGPIPEGLTLDHLCRNTKCVNPSHLEPVTQRENTLRGTSPTATNATKTHCDSGHLLDESNVYLIRGKYGPRRQCRICQRERVRAWRRRTSLQGE